LPYRDNGDLPSSVRNHLPLHAQNIYLAAFNNAWQEYAGDIRRDEISHRVAWAAVKKTYVRRGGDWVAKDAL
jgi:cation transport regulator